MENALQIVFIAILMAALDAPWLLLNRKWVNDFVEDIQGGREMQIRGWAGIPVYLALSYLVTQAANAPRAFFLGLSTYAVYDFTNLFVFDKYPLQFAIADSIWGGLLIAVTWWVANYLGIMKIS